MTRTLEQLREQYEIERSLAMRLRTASSQERRGLYSSVYDELFRKVPHHPQLLRKASAHEVGREVRRQCAFLRRFLQQDATFLEIGPGDCSLSFELARFAKRVYAVDVSAEITKSGPPPANFTLILSDGCSIPVPAESAHVAYSYQLVEHLHPDDAREQLRNIYDALAPGGVYVCVTPNRFGGPWDISGRFDSVAAGLHIKEYSLGELSNLFRAVGFKKLGAWCGARGTYLRLPLLPTCLGDRLLEPLPHRWRRAIIRATPCRMIRLVGRK